MKRKEVVVVGVQCKNHLISKRSVWLFGLLFCSLLSIQISFASSSGPDEVARLKREYTSIRGQFNQLKKWAEQREKREQEPCHQEWERLMIKYKCKQYALLGSDAVAPMMSDVLKVENDEHQNAIVVRCLEDRIFSTDMEEVAGFMQKRGITYDASNAVHLEEKL